MPDAPTDDAKDAKTDGERRNRPFWSGLLTFGLVSIPVDLYPATRAGGAPLRLLDEDGTPLQRRYYCPEEDVDVPSEQLVRGYELAEGKYIVVTDEELESVDPKKSREIDLRLFVERDGIDPLFYEHGYFLAPGEDSGKAYRLLASVMEKSKRAGIATFVMRDQEYLVAILAEGGLLRAETLRFHDEVRSPKSVGLPKTKEPSAALSKKFEHAIAELSTERLPTAELTDEHADRIKELAEKKSKHGQHVTRTNAKTKNVTESEGADVIDLMEALKRSLNGHGGGAHPTKRATHGKAARTTKKAAAHAHATNAKKTSHARHTR
ncbi:MAG TPA: Ku protein [Polyangiaceae bacterium]|nr:Ku protein [Polyangiaceae bacterium]